MRSAGGAFPRWILQRGTVRYAREEGKLIAVAEGRTARTPHRPRHEVQRRAPDHGSYDPAPTIPTQPDGTPVPVARPGSAGRVWESVSAGDVVGPLAKGPLDLREVFAWYAGAQGAQHYGGAHGDAIRYRRRHDDYTVNRATGAKDFAAAGHFESSRGRDVGLGGAYDVGPQRISWAVQMLTDWAGDDGFLHHLSVDLRRPNLFGHVTVWTGVVVEKFAGPAGGRVEIELEARNQHGDVSASGRAEAFLPMDRRPVQLPLRGETPN